MLKLVEVHMWLLLETTKMPNNKPSLNVIGTIWWQYKALKIKFCRTYIYQLLLPKCIGRLIILKLFIFLNNLFNILKLFISMNVVRAGMLG